MDMSESKESDKINLIGSNSDKSTQNGSTYGATDKKDGPGSGSAVLEQNEHEEEEKVFEIEDPGDSSSSGRRKHTERTDRS